MYYSIDAAGSGNTPTICSYVSVKYKGMLTNGNIFDQSSSPVSFQLGGLIESWKKGIPLIKPGGKIKLYCPPSLAYGSQVIKDGSGNVVIPANSILIFEVELVSVSN
jgi:FKBP-type peptidyl-prolyl cis-trans isomerase FkpA